MTVGNRPYAPLFVTVNLTTRCNLDCVYCYMQPRSGLDMAQRDFERIIDELAEVGVFLVTLSGGEPCLHPNFSEMFCYAHKRFTHVMTLTNGTAMRQSHLTTIQQVLDEKGAVTIQVSLDSVEPQVNALTRAPSQRTLRTIEQLTGIGCHVIVAIVVTRHNVSTVVPTIESLSAHTRWFHLMTVQDIRSKPDIEHAFEAEWARRNALWTELRSLATARGLAINYPNDECKRGSATGAPCMAGFSSLVIDPDLNVRPCDRLTDIVLGNLDKVRVSEVWNSTEMLTFTRRSELLCRSAPMSRTLMPIRESMDITARMEL